MGDYIGNNSQGQKEKAHESNDDRGFCQLLKN
jgi:hypothetical protein